MAAMIDLLPFPLLMSVAFPDIRAVQPDEVFGKWVPPESLVQWYLLSVATYTVYSMFMEWRFGATLGKMAVKIRVIGYQGARPNLRETLLRNLSRLIPLCFNPLLPLLVFFPLLNPNKQRLGDLLARTAVIDARFGAAGNDNNPESEGDDSAADHPHGP